MYDKQIEWVNSHSFRAFGVVFPHKYEGKVRIQKNFSSQETVEFIEAWEPSGEDLAFVESRLDDVLLVGEMKSATFVLDDEYRYGNVTFTTDGLKVVFHKDLAILSFDHDLPGVISAQGRTLCEAVPKFEEEANKAVKSLSNLLRNFDIRRDFP